MTKRDKVVQRWRQNPQSVRFSEADAVLRRTGFDKRQRGTSHAVYSRADRTLTIPVRHPFLLPAYVRQILLVLDEIDAEQDGEQ